MTKSIAELWKTYEDYLYTGDEEIDRTFFPTSVLSLNQGIGDSRGIEGGSIVQIIGESSRGKTTLVLDFLAQSQKYSHMKEVTLPDGKKINAIYADFERTFDKSYAKKIGVDVDKVLVVRTPFAEDTFNIIEMVLGAGIQFIVIDSIPMIVPKSEEDKTYDDNEKMAAAAGPLGRFIKRSIQLVDSADAVMFLINQYRSNISPMAKTEKKPYGARIIQYAVRVSIALERIKREDKRMIIEAFVEKTKLGATGRKVQFEIEHGSGIDSAQHILLLASELDIVEKNKAWYYYPTKEANQYKAQGDANAISIFPMEEIKLKVIEAMRVEDEQT